MSQPSASATRALELAAAGSGDARSLHELLPEHLQRVFGCGPVFLAAVDPTTLHFTHQSRRDIPEAAAEEFLAHELGGDDVVRFRDLAGAAQPVDTLFHATHGDPRSSARWRDVIEPLGWGDELRVALKDGKSTWGFLCLHRSADDRDFDPAEVEAMRRLAPSLGAALRRTALGGPMDGADALAPEPGVVVLDDDFVVRSMTGAAERWLELLGGRGDGVPILVMSVSAEAAKSRLPAVVHTIGPDGRWVSVQASPLIGAPGGVAVLLQTAHPREALPALAAATRLTGRETEVAAAVLRGLSGRAIARRLALSENTVQDHLKSIYAKTGVRGRGELVALLLSS